MLKLALNASTSGYKRGILASTEVLRKTALLYPHYSKILNICANALEDAMNEELK